MPRRTPDRPTRALLRADRLEDRELPSFTSSVIFTTGLNNPGSVAVGDLTGDGKPDLAVTNYGSTGAGQTVSVFNNNGSGGFSGTPDFTLDTGTKGATYVAIADLNGDSRQDVVALSAPSSGDSMVRVFINNGASGFTPLAAVDSGGSAGAWLAVGDLDADGDQDVVVANGGVSDGISATGNNIVVLKNNGAGVLSAGATLSVPATGLFGVALPRGVAIADVDGDGKKDIIAVAAQTSFGSEANSSAATFHNTTSGATLSFGSGVSSDTGGLGVFGLAVADFDGDGTPDLAVAHGGTTQIGTAGDGDVAILLNSGASDGKYQTPNVVFGNSRIFAVAVGDFDGKNGVDFAAVEFPNRSSNGPLDVYLNGGNGKTFTKDAQTTTDTGIIGPQFINTGDFNGDGKPDLVVVGENNQGVTYLNVATAPPAAPTGVTATPGNTQVVLNWTAVTGATSYKIYRGTTAGGETLLQSGVTTATFTNTLLTNGTTYFYQVTAVNGAGESGKSAEVSATPQPPAPAAPTGVTATPGNAQVTVTWTGVTGATSYNIYRGTTAGGETLLQTGVTATTFTNTSLTNGTTYFYQVTAVNGGGESPKSAEVSATPQAPPAAPTGVTATPGNTQVVLNWTGVSGAATYNIYRSTTSGGETLLQSGATATTFTDTGLTNGTTYFYQVTAVNVGGESAKSAEVSATPQPPAPAAPTGVTATPGNAQVTVTWTGVTGATSYNIYRGTTSGGETLLQSGVTNTVFTNTSLTNGTTYFYQVTAVNGGGESPRSSEVSATPQPGAPAAPTGVTATPGNAQVVLNWTAVSGATSYRIYRGTTSGGESLLQSGVTGTTFTDTSLTNGTTYFYQVSAINSSGESPKSAEVSATPQPPAPAAPTGVTATPGNTQVVLNWTAAAGASSYNIYRGTTSGGETLLQSGVTTTAFTNAGLTNGTTYFYQVSAINSSGESPKSAEVSATPQPPAPAAPTGVTATPGNTQVVLNWTAVTGATSYKIYRGTTAGGETLLQSGVTATSFTNTLLTNGTTYFYQVTAVNGGGESPKSAEVSATPQTPAPPAAPTGVTATPGNAQVVLNWTAAAGATSYNIYRGTTSGGETLLQSGVTTTAFTNAGLTNGTTYFYQVTAVNGGGESPRSSEVAQAVLRKPVVATGSAPGGLGVVEAFNPATDTMTFATLPFGVYTGGVKVAVGDVNNDGYNDIIAVAGPGALNGLTRIYSGADFSLIGQFFAFPGYAGEWSVAAGDVNGDGKADIIFGTATAHDAVLVYDGGSQTLVSLYSALAPFFGPFGFHGGISVAAGDVNGDGRAEVIVGLKSRFGAAVSTDGLTGGLVNVYLMPVPFAGGVNVAAGDLNGDGRAEVILGTASTAPAVLVYDGATGSQNGLFLAFGGFPVGAQVSTVDRNGDGKAEILVGAAAVGPLVQVYSGLTFSVIDGITAALPGVPPSPGTTVAGSLN